MENGLQTSRLQRIKPATTKENPTQKQQWGKDDTDIDYLIEQKCSATELSLQHKTPIPHLSKMGLLIFFSTTNNPSTNSSFLPDYFKSTQPPSYKLPVIPTLFVSQPTGESLCLRTLFPQTL